MTDQPEGPARTTVASDPRPDPRPDRRPNRRGEGVLLRDDIIRAATRLLEQPGADGTLTLRGVAREAGISAPAIYAHYASPADIAAAVVAATFDDLLATLRAARAGIVDPVERLLAQCRAYIRFAADAPGRYRILFAQPRRAVGRQGDEPAADRPSDAAGLPGAETFRFLVETIAGCVAAGRSDSTDPFADAVALWAALHGYVGLRVATPDFPWPDEQGLIDRMVRGQARIPPTH